MKKNVMMRIASVLLIAVLISTCGISGTYAKYVTSDSGSDTARVAKWGVVTTVRGTLFGDTYVQASEGNKPGTGTKITVDSVDSKKVVAPGTKNEEGITFTLTGTPEVRVNVDIDFTVQNEIKLAAGTYDNDPTTGAEVADPFTVSADYYPVIFTLKKEGVVDPLAVGNVAAIQAKLNELSGEYAANYDLATIGGGTTGKYTLTWEWAIENSVPVGDKVNAMDTYLGNNSTEFMTVTFSCIVEQVD